MPMIVRVEMDGKIRDIDIPVSNPVKVIFKNIGGEDCESDIHVNVTEEGIVVDIVHPEGYVEETAGVMYCDLLALSAKQQMEAPEANDNRIFDGTQGGSVLTGREY